MKNSTLFIIAGLFALFATIAWAIPSRTLGPYVRYVDDSTVGYYIDNPRFVSYLYIYSHVYVCVKCTAAADLVSKTAKEFSGQIYVLGMDASDIYNKKTIERLGINPTTDAFPILIEFPSEHNLNGSPIPVTNNNIDFTWMKKRVTDLIQLQSQVKQLDGTNMKKYLSFKTSSKPKAVLLTTKSQVPAVWASLSSQFSDKYDFFMGLKTDRKVVKRFGVDNFPTIVVLRRNEFNMDQPEDQIEPVIFTGQQKAPIIKAFLSLHVPIDPTKVDTTPFTAYKSLVDTTHDFLPVLSDRKCFEAFCAPDSVLSAGLCLLFVAPTIFSPEEMTFSQLHEIQYQIEVIRGLQELRAESFINLGMVIGQKLEKDEKFGSNEHFTGAYPSFFTSFNIQPQDYPQLIMYNPKKNGYTIFLGAFSPDNINNWIGEVVSTGLTPLGSGITASTIQSGFPDNSPSRCKAIYDKRDQYVADMKAYEDSKKKAQKTGESKAQSIPFHVPEGTPDIDVWNKPYRPATKRGELREMTDQLWSNVFLRRNVSILLQFLDRIPDLSATEPHDINTFRTAVESLNGMIEGYFVRCDDTTTHIRTVFGIDSCDGVIVGVKARAMSTESYEDLAEVEKVLGGSQVIFETTPTEIKSTTQTFEQETLSKWATSKLFEHVIAHRLPSSSDALQQWLLRSIKEPKVMIFTKKDDIALAKALSLEFLGFAQVALVGPDQDSLIHQFQVDSFPAVRILIPRVQPHAGGTNGEMEMKLELIPIPKQQLYYNAIANHLDHVVTTRFVGATLENAAIFEPVRKEHPVETMAREHQEKREQEMIDKYGSGTVHKKKDEL